MNLRRTSMLAGSIALGLLLIGILVRLGKVNLAAMLRQFEGIRPVDFLKLAALNALLVGLSTVKWRSVDAALRRDSDAVPSRIAAFSMSSVGMALGLLLPVQLGMTAARTAGTHGYGRTLKRGTGGTLFEQSFDFLIVVLLGAASAVTWFCGGGAGLWAICALAVVALALATAGFFLRLLRWLADFASGSASRKFETGRPDHLVTRCLRGLGEIQNSGLVKASLARRLLLLSAARFGVLVLMAFQTAAMTGTKIALWKLAAAVPFATISNLIALTPGGVGVNELTSATALHLFGTPLAIASQWAIANRVLVMASCFLVTAVGIISAAVERMVHSGIADGKDRAKVGEA